MSTQIKSNPNRPYDPSAVSIVPKPSGYRDNVRYRPREHGMGYGRSSGYARERQYAQTPNASLFRCA
jgi:hypothetical protein